MEHIMVAKKATKTVEAKVETPAKSDNVVAFDLNQVSETYRKAAETNLEQAKENFEKIKVASDDATKAMEAAMDTAKTEGAELGMKAIDVAQTNLKSSISHFEKLMGVKSVADMIELQSTFVREQTEVVTSQLKTFQEASTKMAQDVTAPVKEVAEKSFKSFK
jgi:phasin